MGFPAYILISRKALADTPDAVKEALRLIDVGGALAASPEDAELARRHVSETVVGFHKPFVLVADFDGPIAVIDKEGKLTPLELSEIEATETPIICPVP